MKKTLKVISSILGILILLVAAMAVFNICPPQGPWPMPPWCPGSGISWPISDPPEAVGDGIEEEQPVAISENERLARVAVGLVADLTTVNTYFNDAASSIGEIQASAAGGWLFAGDLCTGKVSAPSHPAPSLLQVSGQIPQGFLDPLPASGFIPAPEGACAVGASPSVSFTNGAGEKITPGVMREKGIEVISFEELTGGDINGSQLEGTLTGLITPGDMSLASASGWNNQVWDAIAEKQAPAQSLMDYHLWTVGAEIEAAVAASMRTRLESMGLPAQVLNAFDNSRTEGWYAGPAAVESDRLAGMEIEAVFTGKTEGTIYEQRDFSIPVLGEMPVFGPMSGEGSVVYHDPESGDFPFDLDIEWTEWDELGRVTAGKIIFAGNSGVMIELDVRSDGSRSAQVYRNGQQVGLVDVTPEGMITYQDLEG